jgi:hypothetical protein
VIVRTAVEPEADEVRADEAGRARYEESHRRIVGNPPAAAARPLR